MRKNSFKSYKIFMTIFICAISITCIKSIAMAYEPQEIVSAVVIKGEEIRRNENTVEVTDIMLTAGIGDILRDKMMPVELARSINKSETISNINLENNESESTVISNYEETDNTESEETTNTYSEDEIYELAKIIMCEAEGEPQKCKEYVGQVVLNRVKSDKFPDTIHDVIFQKFNGKVQFSPTNNGRWKSVEPNQECYDAAYTVLNAIEPLTDALYFEACKGDSWHSRNLTQVAEIGKTRFYI